MAQIILDMPEYNALKAKAYAFDQLRNNSTLIFSTSCIWDCDQIDTLETDYFINTNAIDKLKGEIEIVKANIDQYIEEKNKVSFDSQLSRLKRFQLKLNNLLNK